MQVNRRQLAEIFGVDQITIGEWQKKADFPPFEKRLGRSGSIYDTAAVIRWYAGAGDNANDRLKRLQGDKVELELARLRGDSLDGAAVDAGFTALGAVVRSVLISVRGRCAPYAEGDALEIIDQAHREALSEFSSDGFVERVRREADSRLQSGDDAATGLDVEPVVGPVPAVKRRGKRGAGAVADSAG